MVRKRFSDELMGEGEEGMVVNVGRVGEFFFSRHRNFHDGEGQRQQNIYPPPPSLGKHSLLVVYYYYAL